MRQDLLNVSMNHFGAERLCNEARLVRKRPRAGPNMSGCDYHRDVRPRMGDFASQREAIECPRHLHIGEQQDDIGVSRLKKLVCGIAMISF